MSHELFILEGVYWVCRSSEPRFDDNTMALIRDVAGTVTLVTREPRGDCIGPYSAIASQELDPQLVGFLASLTRVLADAGVPVMTYSSYERDYILVPLDKLGEAIGALKRAGYRVVERG